MTEQLANTFVSGYPSTNQIIDILLALERGGGSDSSADMLDFGNMPITPPADSPVFKEEPALPSPKAKSDIDKFQSIVSKARSRGLQTPPRSKVTDSSKALAQRSAHPKYVGSIPLVAPSLASDALVYLVAQSGITSARQSLDANFLARLLGQIKKHAAGIPLTVDLGISAHKLFADAGSGRKPKRISAEKVSAKARKTIKHVNPAYKTNDAMEKDTILPDKFGIFGGLYIAEALYECVLALEKTYVECKHDPAFWEEFRSLYPYMGRPSPLHLAERLTEKCGGAKIYLKREDLCHTGSHKINNVVGQILIAKRLGKSRIIAETGAGQHGVATAAICAKLGLECIVYMGSEDMRRQSLNVFRIRALGGKVVPVTKGSCTLKDAINEAMRDLVSNLDTTYHLVSSAIGCHPFPTMVRDFQCVIGNETKEQMKALTGRLPDTLVACVGGGSNAIGMFHPFIKYKSVRLVGAEAAGDGVGTSRHSATLSAGSPGVFHGAKTYLLQDKKGQ
ncbi:hypothetical protein GGI22_004763, partial [Coemansia erecta]